MSTWNQRSSVNFIILSLISTKVNQADKQTRQQFHCRKIQQRLNQHQCEILFWNYLTQNWCFYSISTFSRSLITIKAHPLSHPWSRTRSCTWQLQRWNPSVCWGWGWRACRTRPSSGRWQPATAGSCWSQSACACWPSTPRWWAGSRSHSQGRWVSRGGSEAWGPHLFHTQQTYLFYHADFIYGGQDLFIYFASMHVQYWSL